jgi:hypothetical protein
MVDIASTHKAWPGPGRVDFATLSVVYTLRLALEWKARQQEPGMERDLAELWAFLGEVEGMWT